MLETIAIILIVLWLLGMVSSYTVGGFIHVLLVAAIIIFLVRIIQGRPTLEHGWLFRSIHRQTSFLAMNPAISQPGESSPRGKNSGFILSLLSFRTSDLIPFPSAFQFASLKITLPSPFRFATLLRLSLSHKKT